MANQHVFTGIGRTVVLADDLDGALAFYRDVLGFEVLHDSTEDGYRYLHMGVPGQAGAGVWLMPAAPAGERPDDRPHLVLYTDDLSAVRSRLARHGVRTWAETDAPDSASLHFADPYGNVLIAARPKPSPAPAGAADPGLTR